jgi:hypothetical protein
MVQHVASDSYQNCTLGFETKLVKRLLGDFMAQTLNCRR